MFVLVVGVSAEEEALLLADSSFVEEEVEGEALDFFTSSEPLIKKDIIHISLKFLSKLTYTRFSFGSLYSLNINLKYMHRLCIRGGA